mmetsp:Transcript_17136/g.25490  ORF Transcript_17136/g.25490 Transcript_17136/m.25490 type:complete len:252 (+) Transcript_17136:157-912(+)|eukprot:CAMPEP_0201559854 /NCGR_PEP_ID=MMETSP0173_2-20130828/76813_1 /ASSEMBLY_ACC=CAM_ASM_000268 /TAXON_ID=218659 /ORGANISM="Vexillifera sp., Strain DIVA3 564/2" /LENGTH=251 /DNA_ID=CAMNT_0047974171 /DNA_START=353 /DNA_END=1108 /DNA_ORIENTATION=+
MIDNIPFEILDSLEPQDSTSVLLYIRENFQPASVQPHKQIFATNKGGVVDIRSSVSIKNTLRSKFSIRRTGPVRTSSSSSLLDADPSLPKHSLSRGKHSHSPKSLSPSTSLKHIDPDGSSPIISRVKNIFASSSSSSYSSPSSSSSSNYTSTECSQQCGVNEGASSPIFVTPPAPTLWNPPEKSDETDNLPNPAVVSKSLSEAPKPTGGWKVSKPSTTVTKTVSSPKLSSWMRAKSPTTSSPLTKSVNNDP